MLLIMPLKDPDKRREYHRDYMRRYFKAHQAKRVAQVKRVQRGKPKRYAVLKKIVAEFKEGGCFLCSECNACCLSAHHMLEKTFSISEVLVRAGVSKLKAELAKCVCLCENCHRKVHAGVIKKSMLRGWRKRVSPVS